MRLCAAVLGHHAFWCNSRHPHQAGFDGGTPQTHNPVQVDRHHKGFACFPDPMRGVTTTRFRRRLGSMCHLESLPLAARDADATETSYIRFSS
jgi:hypothetical protein